MSDFFPAWDPFERTLASLSAGGASANLQAGLPYLAVRLASSGRSVLVLTDESRGELLAEDARVFFSQTDRPSEGSVGFLSSDMPFRDRSALLEQAVEGKPLVWFTSRAVIAAGAPSRAEFSDARLVVKVGKALSHGSLVEKLSRQGYQRVGLVEDPGQFAVRGEVFDFIFRRECRN
jgi:transcription-repair coupling factor (superfamily II helicase)